MIPRAAGPENRKIPKVQFRYVSRGAVQERPLLTSAGPRVRSAHMPGLTGVTLA